MSGPDLSGFNPLDEQYRYCVYCQADCWPERENQQHKPDCPFNTGIYPVLEQDRHPSGDLGLCSACSSPFALGDMYVHISDETGIPVTNPAEGSTTWIACITCGITLADPRPVEGES